MNFVECESFFQSKLPWDSCCMWDKLGWLNWFLQFLCEGLSSFNQEDSVTHMLGLAVYAKEGVSFAWYLYLEPRTKTLQICMYFFDWLCFLQYHFFLYGSLSSSLCMVSDISSNIDQILSINLCAYVFVFRDFNIYHKDWLIYSGGTDRSGELCCNIIVFYMQSNLYKTTTFGTTQKWSL